MSKMKWAYAPYNFIPFDDAPHRRYDSVDMLPRHDTWDPNLLSGEISVSITAETPIFVGNGKKGAASDFHRNLDGNYAIPGSTLRGLIRENMQILGFGAVRKDEDFQDYRLLYRRMADAKGSLGAGLKEDYESILGIKNGRPQNVRPGYLCYDGDDRYHIVPVDKVYFAKRNDPENGAWEDAVSKNEPVYFKTVGDEEGKACRAVLSRTEQDGYREGVVHCVGRMKNRDNPEFDQNTLYVFPEFPENEQGFPLTEEDIINYKEDYKARRNTLRGTEEPRMNPAFWDLPQKVNQHVPVFFCQHADYTDFGTSRYLRIAYNRSLLDGLPEGQKQAYDETGDSPFIDYPYAILGFSGRKKSYRTRVVIGDLTANTNIKPQTLYKAKLGEPKISFFPGYVQNGKDYNNETFQFRGFKQYWIKPEEKQKLEVVDPQESTSEFVSMLRPLPMGTVFSGVIRYRNLAPDELGLLLWCLTLDEGCRQNIGRGKPLGYGRVQIEVTDIREYDPRKLYGGGNLLSYPTRSDHTASRVKELIDEYKKAMGLLGTMPPKILDFLFMKNPVASFRCFSYMNLRDFQNLSMELPTVADYRERRVIPDHEHIQVFRIGAIVEAKITRIKDFGFFAELKDGSSGLVHFSEIGKKGNESVRFGTIDQFFSVGEIVQVKILPPRDGKLSLSYKQAGNR